MKLNQIIQNLLAAKPGRTAASNATGYRRRLRIRAERKAIKTALGKTRQNLTLLD
jgi:hypothetical protein